MDSQPLKTKDNQVTSLREQLHAGKASKSEQELEMLYEQFILGFSNDLQNNLIGKDFNLTEAWLQNFIIVNEDNFADELMKKIDTAKFYEWGEYLQKKLEEKSQKILKNIAYEYLNLFRRSSFLKRIYEEKKWEALIYNLIKSSNYNVNSFFKQRVRDYADKTLFKVIGGNEFTEISWTKFYEGVEKYSRAIYRLTGNNEDFKIAFLLENSPEMPLLDMACLTTGIVNVMIPANSVAEHIRFILNQTKAPYIIAFDEKQLSKLKTIKNDLSYLEKVILLRGTSAEDWVVSFDEFVDDGNEIEQDIILNKAEKVTTDSLATIMYTSGTTGEPKGIMFSQMNIVYKRFCRAMALPEIGDKDRFLSYLPLFHTFGRWFEMTGSMFWGAEYCFMENPALETMIANMQLVKPTVFISIPKKWIQLYEHISSKVDIEVDEKEKIVAAVKETTGGELKWGLSAAGYLPPDIFRFFQMYGIELMSGFGMTEATGGITMTPPKRYKENSLGKALPGIEIKLADDGEILIRGPYVMRGYFGKSKEETFTKDGWLPTGDIMKMDEDGFIQIIDRKKEIYKNIKGETIAPQKIENYFNEFDSVKQVFLVGDHRPFNTVLIYPDYDSETVPLKEMSDQQKQDYFSSLVVTVNKFLAPFERIVDFRIIDREFSADKGELTPKGTYKRREIEKNFAKVIQSMYTKNFISLRISGFEIRMPNWFLREKSCLSRDIIVEKDKIKIPKISSSLTIKKTNDGNNLYRIGSFIYEIKAKHIDMQLFLTNPFYWLGNREFFDFTGEAIYSWYRQHNAHEKVSFYSTAAPINLEDTFTEQLRNIYINGEYSLTGLHLASLLLQSGEDENTDLAINYLHKILSDETNHYYNLALEIAHRPNLTKSLNARRRLFEAAAAKLSIVQFENLINLYLGFNKDLLNEHIISYLVEIKKGEKLPEVFERIVRSEIEFLDNYSSFEDSPLPSLFNLLQAYSKYHPTSFKRIRRFIMRYAVFGKTDALKQKAEQTLNNLQTGLREWLGNNQQVAVDMETGEEYNWQDVLIFEDGIDPEDRQRMKNALTKTSLLREAVFLFSTGNLIRLNNILPAGVWISHLETKPYKSIYRVTLQTRFQGAYDITVHLTHNLPPSHVKEEIKWLILPATTSDGKRLLPKFGGYWEEYELWTEEFVSRESIEKFIQKTVRKNAEPQLQRLYHLWPFFVWNAATAYTNFWKLTNYQIELANPLPENVSSPTHDYQIGTLLYSVSKRVKSNSISEFFKNFYVMFIKKTIDKHDFLKRDSIWNYIFSGLLDVEGEELGLKSLKIFDEQIDSVENFPDKEIIKEKLDEFITNVEEKGFIPKSLFFAIKRFHRWFKLNKDASFTAQAEMLYELYETYHLFDLEESYPSTRTLFFLETAFIESDKSFKNALREISSKQHDGLISKEKILKLISGLQSQFKLNKKEDFFLTRLSYPHLKPSDMARLLKVKTEIETSSNLVVQIIDDDGKPFIIRNPISPKEISRLHQLFFETNLDVHFKPEHNFLVAISERGFIIGGLYYFKSDEETAHMEKIVVSNRYRRKGISEALMNELFNRLRSEHTKFVTTGFFRPEYFYKFGFKIERKYSGLVKDLFADTKK